MLFHGLPARTETSNVLKLGAGSKLCLFYQRKQRGASYLSLHRPENRIEKCWYLMYMEWDRVHNTMGGVESFSGVSRDLSVAVTLLFLFHKQHWPLGWLENAGLTLPANKDPKEVARAPNPTGLMEGTTQQYTEMTSSNFRS